MEDKNHISCVKKIADLLPYVNNSRTHSDDQINQVAASIKEFGFTNPVLIDSDGGIIAGHGRVMAAKKLGISELPCIELVGFTAAQKKAYVIADNQLALNAGWNLDTLKIELESLDELDFNLDLLGFDDDFLNDLMIDDPAEGLTDEDAVPEPPETPVSVLGDIWQLGNHRLMCGDSTSIDAVEKLMDGHKADMVFTDPPYGINEKGDRSNRKGAESLSDGVKYEEFKDDSTQYAIDAYNLCEGLGIKRQVWWGANYYCHSLPQSNNWFIWDKRIEDKQKDFNSDCEMAWVKSEFSSVRIFRHLWKGLIKGSEHGIARVHPTQKPIALAEWSFDYFKNVSTVIDLFGGSGSTLIACEKTNRSCFMMELSENYADVIISRWEQFTGKQAIHIESGKTYAQLKDSGVECNG
jgi:DNA modification methylase